MLYFHFWKRVLLIYINTTSFVDSRHAAGPNPAKWRRVAASTQYSFAEFCSFPSSFSSLSVLIVKAFLCFSAFDFQIYDDKWIEWKSKIIHFGISGAYTHIGFSCSINFALKIGRRIMSKFRHFFILSLFNIWQTTHIQKLQTIFTYILCVYPCFFIHFSVCLEFLFLFFILHSFFRLFPLVWLLCMVLSWLICTYFSRLFIAWIYRWHSVFHGKLIQVHLYLCIQMVRE